MENVYRRTLHCKKGTTDKVYIVDINKEAAQTRLYHDKYYLTATWGRREGRLTSMVRGEFYDLAAATRAADKLVDDKMRRGTDKYQIAKPMPSIETIQATSAVATTQFKVQEAVKQVKKEEQAKKATTNSFRNIRL